MHSRVLTIIDSTQRLDNLDKNSWISSDDFIVVQELKNLSQTFIVKGIGALADGLAQTAKGNLFSAGLFYKSSAKYFAAFSLEVTK